MTGTRVTRTLEVAQTLSYANALPPPPPLPAWWERIHKWKTDKNRISSPKAFGNYSEQREKGGKKEKKTKNDRLLSESYLVVLAELIKCFVAKDVAYCSRSFCFCFFQKLIFFSFCIFLHFAQITYALPEIMNIIITGGDEKVRLRNWCRSGKRWRLRTLVGVREKVEEIGGKAERERERIEQAEIRRLTRRKLPSWWRSGKGWDCKVGGGQRKCGYCKIDAKKEKNGAKVEIAVSVQIAWLKRSHKRFFNDKLAVTSDFCLPSTFGVA